MTTTEERVEQHRTRAAPRQGADPWWGRLTLAGLAVGTLWRLGQWWSTPSLWLDEASIANNILERSYAGLAEPLVYEQGAPVGWLWIERTMTHLFGDGEAVLRLWPFLAGVATVFVAWALARRLLGPRATAAYVAMVALWPPLVQYTGELKQYSTDTLASVLILLLAVRVQRGESRARLHLAIAGSVLLWVSIPAVICLAAVGVVLGVDDLRRRDRIALRADVAIAAAWAVTLAVLWVVALSDLSSSVIVNGWANGYAPALTRPAAWLQFLRRETLGLFGVPESALRYAMGMLMVVGAWRLVRRVPKRFALLASVPVLALVASQLKRYPYIADRPSLYLLPIWLLLVASAIPEPLGRRDDAVAVDPRSARPVGSGEGASEADPNATFAGSGSRGAAVGRAGERRVAALGTVVVALVVVSSWALTTRGQWWMVNPTAKRHDARALLRDLAEVDHATTPIYLYRFSGTSYRYYDRHIDLPRPQGAFRLADADRKDGSTSPISECKGPISFEGAPGIWVVYTFPDPLFPPKFLKQLDIIRSLGTVRNALYEYGAVAFEFAPPPDPAVLCRISNDLEGIRSPG